MRLWNRAFDKWRQILVEQWHQRSLKLFDIENANVCALCEKPLSWMADAPKDKIPVAIDIHHAICKPCFETLKGKYPYE